jgi:hypothetical protein
MESQVMAQALEDLRAHRIDFAAFYARTQRDWERIAQDLYRRWPLPAGIEACDVEQDLLLAVHKERLVWRWQPERGKSLVEFVVWNAQDKAKKEIHKTRDSKRRSGSAPGRFALPLSSLHREGEEGEQDQRQDEESAWASAHEDDRDAEIALGGLEVFTSVLNAMPCRRDREALLHLVAAGGSVRDAAASILDDPGAAVACRVDTVREGERAVRVAAARARRVAREVVR